MGHRDFFNLKEPLKFKKSLLGLGRWLSWCNVYLASMRTWVPSPGLNIKKRRRRNWDVGLMLRVPALGRWRQVGLATLASLASKKALDSI